MLIVAHNVQSTLEAAGSTCQDISVVCNTHCSDTKGTNIESKLWAIESFEERIDVSLEVTAGTDMTLPISFKLNNSSTEFAFQFDVTFSILVSILVSILAIW